MLEIDRRLVEQFQWSLWEINETDSEELLRFVFSFLEIKGPGGTAAKRLVKCDAAGSWLL